MRIYLNVPFSDKDKVKSLGARWDSEKRLWYVNNPENLFHFNNWLSKEVKDFYSGHR